MSEMKNQTRILGIDDSPFKFEDEDSLVVGALVRAPNYLEAVMKTRAKVDGMDSTDRLIELVHGSRYKAQIKAVMIDGIALAGFNVIDVERLYESTSVPVLTITRDKPDFKEIESALKKHFTDWKDRLGLMTRLDMKQIRTEHKPLFACGVGLDWSEFEELARQTTVRGALPEPLRIAHLISSALVLGESRGRA